MRHFTPILIYACSLLFIPNLTASERPAGREISPHSKATKAITQQEQLISLNLQDVSIRYVLQLLAEHSGVNIAVSDSVSGQLSLRLDKVTWQQALAIILNLQQLEKQEFDNTILIVSKAEFDRREKAVLEKAQQAIELKRLTSVLVPVQYANAVDVAQMIGGDSATSMLTARGSIAVDQRTNALLVRDVANNIDTIKQMILALDVPIKQVEIEARIVTMNQGSIEDIGVRWGSRIQQEDMTARGTTAGGYSGSKKNASQAAELGDLLKVNLGTGTIGAPRIAFQVAKLGSGVLLDLELSALQAESKAEIISAPRLLTTNKHPAYIEQGTEIPYLEASSSGATSVSFKKAVLSLKVTPHILPGNHLVLDLAISQDKPGELTQTGEGLAVAIDTQRIGTQVLVDDGETIVLGGIFEISHIATIDKVPLLGDIPLLKFLFRRSYESNKKRQLLIFVTPSVQK
jgi:type IV pilus assembly protein PilQ